MTNTRHRASQLGHHPCDRKNASLQGPALDRYKMLYEHVAEVLEGREEGRFGSVVEPMLQWAKLRPLSPARNTCHARPASCPE